MLVTLRNLRIPGINNAAPVPAIRPLSPALPAVPALPRFRGLGAAEPTDLKVAAPPAPTIPTLPPFPTVPTLAPFSFPALPSFPRRN